MADPAAVTVLPRGLLPELDAAGTVRDRPGETYGPFTFPGVNLSYIDAGRGPWRLGDRALLLEPGSVYLTPAGTASAGASDPSLGGLSCRYAIWRWRGFPDGGRAPLRLPRRVRLAPAERREVLAVLDELAATATAGREHWQLAGGGLLAVALALIARAAARPEGDADAPMQRALTFMQRHFRRPLAVDEVARAAGLSRDWFERAFRAELGVPPLRHLIRLRLREARRLLAVAPDLTLAACAERVGIADARHLKRLFRRHLGTTPGDVRALHWGRGSRARGG